MDLARTIVTDFHGRAAAARAAEEFTRVVRRHEVPAELESVPLPDGVRNAAGLRLDKLLAKTGLAESVTDAVRKIKAGAVEINGEKIAELVLTTASGELTVHVGKRWKQVTL